MQELQIYVDYRYRCQICKKDKIFTDKMNWVWIKLAPREIGVNMEKLKY